MSVSQVFVSYSCEDGYILHRWLVNFPDTAYTSKATPTPFAAQGDQIDSRASVWSTPGVSMGSVMLLFLVGFAPPAPIYWER